MHKKLRPPSLSLPTCFYIYTCSLPILTHLVLNSSHIIRRRKQRVSSLIAMEIVTSRLQYFLMAIFALALLLGVPTINAQSPAPAPPPTSDGMAIDQGIAYVLMLVALLVTYIIH